MIIRDYGMYDMTQMRFINKRGRKLGENFYMRADGTRTYFFSKGAPPSLSLSFSPPPPLFLIPVSKQKA